MTAIHALIGGKVHVYRRPNTPHWHCSATVGGKRHRRTTKEDDLDRAKDVAEGWYLELMGKNRWGGGFVSGPTFKKAALKFLDEYETITLGERNETYVKGHHIRVNLHLLPFFGDKALSEITPGLVQEYRIHRRTSRVNKDGAFIVPSRSTMHQEIVTLRQILKTANRHGWIAHVPNLSPPYKTSGKITRRAWFSPEEYVALYKQTGEWAETPPDRRSHEQWRTLHDYVLIMGNCGLRPDEALRLEFRDVKVVKDIPTGEHILEIDVRGKRGVGYCKSMPNAVFPFERLKKRRDPEPADKLFPDYMSKLLNLVLIRTQLKHDRDGQVRTAYSLRHTYICMRLMEGADIYQIAKNCRTSVEMIETYYASHIRHMIDASAINVTRKKPAAARKRKDAAAPPSPV